MADRAIRAMYIDSCREATVEGYVRDFVLNALPWAFALGEIAVPTLVWHGTDDIAVPVQVGKTVPARIPRERARILPREGHLFAHAHAEEILGELVAASR